MLASIFLFQVKLLKLPIHHFSVPNFWPNVQNFCLFRAIHYSFKASVKAQSSSKQAGGWVVRTQDYFLLYTKHTKHCSTSSINQIQVWLKLEANLQPEPTFCKLCAERAIFGAIFRHVSNQHNRYNKYLFGNRTQFSKN